MHPSQVDHQAGAYCGFGRMKQLLPRGWDAKLLQGYPPALNSPVPGHIYTWVEAV